MEKHCAWCGGALGGTRDGRPVSHGICDRCRDGLVEHMPIRLGAFLESLPGRVLLVTGDAAVEGLNGRASRALGKSAEEARGLLSGDVFECAHARLPGGCGRTVHCSGCVIRMAVTHTHRTGEAHREIPATLTRADSTVRMRVSTERVDDRVLLRIDPADPGPAVPPAGQSTPESMSS